MDLIIEHSWPEQNIELQSKLIIAISNYRKAMDLLMAHQELSEEENKQFQDYMTFRKFGLRLLASKEWPTTSTCLGAGIFYISEIWMPVFVFTARMGVIE